MRLTFQIMLNETHKGLLLLWDYRFNLLMEAIIIACVFVGLNFLIGNGEMPEDQLASTLLGYIIWLYTFMAVSNMGWSLREEVQTGTLEQMFMGPVPTPILMLGRSLSTLISTSVTILLIGSILIPLFNIAIPARAAGLLIFAWTMIGLFGLGFMVGGATLVYKHVESLAYLLQYGLVFLNGSMLPVEKFPDWLAFVARMLPGTQGIIVLRSVVLDGHSLRDTWLDGSLRWLGLHSMAFFALGWLIFTQCARLARQRGTLGQY